MALPILATAGKAVFAGALKGLFGLFDYKKKDEQNRLRHREEECRKLAGVLEAELENDFNIIRANPLPKLSYAIGRLEHYKRGYVRRKTYFDQGRYEWPPHDKFDYPSAKVGAEGRLMIQKQALIEFEKFVIGIYPTRKWDTMFVAQSSVISPGTENQNILANTSLKQLAIPAGIFAIGLLIK